MQRDDAAPADVGDGVGSDAGPRALRRRRYGTADGADSRHGLYTLFPALAGGERINEHGILKRSKRRTRIPCSLMSMLLLLSRARASDVYCSSVRLPDISMVVDADGSGIPSGHLRVPIHVDPDTTPRSRGSIHPPTHDTGRHVPEHSSLHLLTESVCPTNPP